MLKNIRHIFSTKTKSKAGTFNEVNRQMWVKTQLESLPPGLKILDAGAGEMQYKKYCSHLNYVSQDFAQYNPSKLEKGLQMTRWNYGELDYVCDIASLPVEDNSFDVVLCTEVFEHIIHPHEALVEFKRILKPGGYLILTAPFCSLTHFAPYHYYSGFSRFFYEQKLNALKFDILELYANGNYFEYLAQELLRLQSVAKKYVNDIALTNSELNSIRKIHQKLEDLSAMDKGSEELLCYGFHVKARKAISNYGG